MDHRNVGIVLTEIDDERDEQSRANDYRTLQDQRARGRKISVDRGQGTTRETFACVKSAQKSCVDYYFCPCARVCCTCVYRFLSTLSQCK
jgi:hypothetical protein